MQFYLLIGILILVVILQTLLLIRKPKPDREQLDEIRTVSQKQDMTMKTVSDGFTENRRELSESLDKMSANLLQMTKQNYEHQIQLNEAINRNLNVIRDVNTQEAERHSKKLDDAIKTLQESNEKKLDQMRQTVDEKLTATLSTRLDSSFKTVSEQLENVYKSLGEMKELSTGVTTNVRDLNRVLTNVKSRGTWAEVQLENILKDTLPTMYEKNVATNPKSLARVEFAVKIPAADSDEITYLPIDSKFPIEDYARIRQASENADPAALEAARKALENRIKDEAKEITKYINVPVTTPFAIMYLATEGLYAEALTLEDGLIEQLHTKYKIMLAGPTTITALLNSLQMGFSTMTISQRANEVWKILGVAKKQYDDFGTLLDRAKKKVDEAGAVLEKAQSRNNIIQKKLKSVETIEDTETELLENE